MALPRSTSRLVTLAEYYAFEETTPERHEFFAGVVHAMGAPTRTHSRIIARITQALRAAIGERPCEVFSEMVKLQVDVDAVYHPDVLVSCDVPADDDVTLTSACVVVEVTSRSTRMTDRREKRAAYQRNPTVQTYLIVAQSEPRVDVWQRDANGEWQYALLTPESDPPSVAVPCLDTRLPLATIYERIVFKPRPRRVYEDASPGFEFGDAGEQYDLEDEDRVTPVVAPR